MRREFGYLQNLPREIFTWDLDIPNSFKGSKLWKLDGDKLQNKAFPHTWTGTSPTWDINGMTMRDNFDKWNFKTKDDLIYIENVSKRRVLGTTSDGKVILEDIEEGKIEQLWKKGEPNAEGYFTLENYKVPMVLTAISSRISEIKGNINMKQMHS